jgi:hypothetical protein
MSEKQQDTMLADINVIYKNKLYYNLYRYKVDIVCYRSEGMDFIDNFRDFITENFEEGSYKFSNGFSSYDYYFKSPPVSIFGSTYVPWRIAASVYLKNYEDLCTIHMIYKNDICKTTKVALFSEA